MSDISKVLEYVKTLMYLQDIKGGDKIKMERQGYQMVLRFPSLVTLVYNGPTQSIKIHYFIERHGVKEANLIKERRLVCLLI